MFKIGRAVGCTVSSLRVHVADCNTPIVPGKGISSVQLSVPGHEVTHSNIGLKQVRE